MLLRTRIFRHLVLISLIPALILSLISYYLLARSVEQAGSWMAGLSPERTINALRLTEERLQGAARAAVTAYLRGPVVSRDSVLDWLVVMDGATLTHLVRPRDGTDALDSALSVIRSPGPIRLLIEGKALVGSAVDDRGRIVAGGYLLGREYLDGFASATSGLSESRNYTNLRPALVLFTVTAGAVVLIAVLVLASILSRRLSASITVPLERLTALTASIGRGEQPHGISPEGTDEIVRLTDMFNKMMTDLDSSRKRLAASERVAAWQEFARRMAHELKNPLTPIALSLYRIRKKLEDHGQYEPFADSLEAIAAEISHLERLAADYASLARLPEPKIAIFDFIGLVKEVIRLHAAQLEGHQYRDQLAPHDIMIQGDPDRLREVMVNLIKNAIEFSRPGGRITIAAEGDDATVSFAVSNDNRDGGVTEADLRAAKLPYVSTRKGGMGLGLAIAEKIIIDHGGTLTLRLMGTMTEARFEIPRQPSRKEGLS